MEVQRNGFLAKDITLNRRLTLPASFIREQFHRFDRIPVWKRYEAMTDYILSYVEVKHRITVSNPEKRALKNELKSTVPERATYSFTGNFMSGWENPPFLPGAKTEPWNMLISLLWPISGWPWKGVRISAHR